jgi:DNA-directed RNA polymerase specialized sigma24 family protein
MYEAHVSAPGETPPVDSFLLEGKRPEQGDPKTAMMLGSITLREAIRQDYIEHPDAIYSFTTSYAELSSSERARKEAAHPLYRGIIPSSQIPVLEENPELPIQITIKDGATIECNGKQLELQNRGLFIFNATLLLLKNQPIAIADVFSYHPEVTNRYAAFTQYGMPLIASINEMAGEEVITPYITKNSRGRPRLEYTVSPRLVFEDERPDLGETLGEAEFICLSGAERATAERFVATMHRVVGKRMLEIAQVRYPEDPEAVVQDVWLGFHEAVLRGKVSFPTANNAVAWLITVVNYKVVDRIRKRKPVLPVGDTELLLGVGTPLYEQPNGDDSDRRVDALTLGEVPELIPWLLEGLSPVEKKIAQEILIDGNSRKTAAEKYSMTTGGVRVALFRARTKMREKIEKLSAGRNTEKDLR